MVKIQWTHFLTGKDDATIGNVTFLSRPAEWHAVLIGLVCGFVGSQAILTALGAYMLGRSNKLLSYLDSLPDTLHARDAMREPAYAAGGAVIGYVIQALAFGAVVLP